MWEDWISPKWFGRLINKINVSSTFLSISSLTLICTSVLILLHYQFVVNSINLFFENFIATQHILIIYTHHYLSITPSSFFNSISLPTSILFFVISNPLRSISAIHIGMAMWPSHKHGQQSHSWRKVTLPPSTATINYYLHYYTFIISFEIESYKFLIINILPFSRFLSSWDLLKFQVNLRVTCCISDKNTIGI